MNKATRRILPWRSVSSPASVDFFFANSILRWNKIIFFFWTVLQKAAVLIAVPAGTRWPIYRLPSNKLELNYYVNAYKMENITRIIWNSLHDIVVKTLSGERGQPFIIIRRDENNSTSKIRNRKKNTTREESQKSGKKTRKRIRRFSQIFSARGCWTDTKRYSVLQLLKQTRPTTSIGYECTHSWNEHAKPFLGRAITMMIYFEYTIKAAFLAKSSQLPHTERPEVSFQLAQTVCIRVSYPCSRPQRRS